jgi:hypothetical protein
MKELLNTLWFMFMAPFYKDLWEDEEAFTAYFGCVISCIFLVAWLVVLCMLVYLLYLGIIYLETLV